jgi:Ca2+/Na+ antiporter
MIINSIRLLAFIILFVIIIIRDIPFKKIFKDAIIQLYIAIFCISILILIDNISGFILTLSALIIYFRIYSDEIKKKNELDKRETLVKSSDASETKDTSCCSAKHHGKCGEHCKHGDKCSMDIPKKKNIFNDKADDNSVPYITEENLLAAQTNIVDIDNYKLNIENADLNDLDVKKGPLYKIQGLPDISENNQIRGYDIQNEYLGKMYYNIV